MNHFERLTRAHVAVVVAGGLLAAVAATTLRGVVAADDLFIDYVFYRDLAWRFLTDGSYYGPSQLAGPYEVTLMSDVLYPPSALLLFVPFAWIPALFWWLVPIAITIWIVVGWRPSLAGVAGMLLLLAWPRAHAAFLYGNTDMWVMAGVAAGLRWGWPALLVALKPTFLPLAAIGIRRRSWWLGAIALAGVAAFQLPLWLDYVQAVTNLRGSVGYSLGSIPLVIIPIVAWWTSRSRSRAGASAPTRDLEIAPG